MKHIIRLFIISLLSLWALDAGAQSHYKSVLRAGVISSEFSSAQIGLSLEYAYRLSPYFSAAIMINEEAMWKGDCSGRQASVIGRGYYRPYAQKEFWRRWETGLGLGYESIFMAYETRAPKFSDMEYNQKTHRVMKVEVPFRYYILDAGRLELAAEFSGILGVNKEWHYFGYCAALRLGVAF